MRLSKIYTRTGDSGSTRLSDGSSVRKSDARIEAYGTVDELNSMLGLLRDHVSSIRELDQLDSMFLDIQHELFDIGSELASPKEFIEKYLSKNLVNGDHISRLEIQMDKFNEHLNPLKNFVLPGGHVANSTAHLCRTICRRSERQVIRLCEKESIRPEVLKYLNRLSDWFFVVGRYISNSLEIEEVLWNQER